MRLGPALERLRAEGLLPRLRVLRVNACSVFVELAPVEAFSGADPGSGTTPTVETGGLPGAAMGPLDDVLFYSSR